METCINYCSTDCAYVSSDERHWITVVRKLKENHPNEVRILRQPEQNDGCIYAVVPVKWVRINPPKKVVMTEERKKELSDRLRQIRRNSHEPKQ